MPHRSKAASVSTSVKPRRFCSVRFNCDVGWLERQGQCVFEVGQNVGWDQRRFAAPAHQQFATFEEGGPALEASWSHPTLKKAMAVAGQHLRS